MLVRKLLRSIGIALIVLPEPFTTPLGLALLGAAYMFGRSSRVDRRRYLRRLITRYLSDARPFRPTGKIIQHKLKTSLPGREWYSPPKGTGEESIRCGIDSRRLLLRYGHSLGRMSSMTFPVEEKSVRHSLNQRWAGYVWPILPAAVVAEKTVKHTLDSSRLALRYSDGRGSRLTVADKVMYHSLKSRLSGYVLRSEPQEKLVSHSIGKAKCLTPGIN